MASSAPAIETGMSRPRRAAAEVGVFEGQIKDEARNALLVGAIDASEDGFL